MTRVIETDEKGAIHLAAEWLQSKPHTRYAVEIDGRTVILRPQEEQNQPLWKRLTPEERADEFLNWANHQHSASVHLTDEQLRRENIYE